MARQSGAKGERAELRQVWDVIGHWRAGFLGIQFGRRCNEAGRIDIVVNDRLGTVDMPPTIPEQYQYFTQATVQNLRPGGPQRRIQIAVTSFLGISLTGIGEGGNSTANVRQSMFDFEDALKLIGSEVLCVGDLMLDDFVYGDVVAHLAGGAGAGPGGEARGAADRWRRQRGARHCRARRSCIFVGVIGEDEAGRILMRALPAETADRAASGGRSCAPNDAQGSLRLRTSFHSSAARRLGDWPTVRCETEKRLIERALAALPRAASVVLSDYAKGVLTPRVIRAVIEAARNLASP